MPLRQIAGQHLLPVVPLLLPIRQGLCFVPADGNEDSNSLRKAQPKCKNKQHTRCMRRSSLSLLSAFAQHLSVLCMVTISFLLPHK